MDKNKIIEAAAKLVQKGAYDKAIKEYQKVLDADPKDVRVLQKMGELYQKKNDNGLAATFFSRVAETYSADGFFLKAVALYKQVLKLSPGLVEINLKLAELHQQLGLITEAMAYFQIVANHYDKVGDTRSSLDTLKRMVDLDPDNVASRIKLAELYARENIREEAVEEFRRAADYLKRHNRTDDYLRVAERITALTPEDVTMARELAAQYLQRGDQKRALAKLQLCFKANPRDIETLGLLAEAFQGLGQTSKTLSVYKELAKIYAEGNQTDLANGVWNKVAALDPHDPDLQARRGQGQPAATRTTQPQAAAPARPAAPARVAPAPAAAAAPAPTPKESLAKLLTETDVYVKYGLHEKALDHLRKVFAVDPENLDAHEKAYHIYVGSQHMQEAAEQLLNVLRLLTRKGDVERAQPYLKTILHENPRHPEVPAFLAVLQKAGQDLAAPEQLPEDAILVEADEEEVIVGEAPDDALAAEPEDLALASTDAPEEVVDDAMVMGEPQTDSWDPPLDDEPLIQPEPTTRTVIPEEGPTARAPAPIPTRSQPAARAPAPIPTRSQPAARAPATIPPKSQPAARAPATIPPKSQPAARAPATIPPKSQPAARAPATVPPPAAKPAPSSRAIAPPPPAEDPVAQECEEAAFLLEQGALDEARDILETLVLAHPDHPGVTALLQQLEARSSVDTTRPDMLVPDVPAERDAFDLAAELAEEAGPVEEGGVAIDAGGEDFQYSVEEVFEEFKKGLEKVVKPEDVETHYDLGIAYKEMGLFDDAIQEFNVARQGCLKKKKEVDCLTMMGLLQVMKGDAASAVTSFQQALGTEFATGETGKALEFELGQAWEASGNVEKALAVFQKVAAQDPGYRGVGEMVTRLKAAAPKTRKVGYL